MATEPDPINVVALAVAGTASSIATAVATPSVLILI